ncbi:MAG: hypothetical protein DM484_17740 [Candidatus Methylumidiphilus alinenensis]|uniref:Uncharacterized protein n=1 Tax=Candidatus Methylumidiphilus alinenensis TaxID=2202197 RepID=A0A2W4SZL1_9GAMM|nr:MAG: hypothetical protein DM484_17740 [Candidatus Methylumidiphilus alinenensis]
MLKLFGWLREAEACPRMGFGVGMNHPVTDFQHGKAALDWAEVDREIIANKITKLATKLEMY